MIDDIIADDSLDKKRTSLLDLAISGRHRKHSLWILTQSYTAIPKNIRRQAKMFYVWNPKCRNDMNIILGENDVVDVGDERKIKKELKSEKYICLVICMEFPQSYRFLN